MKKYKSLIILLFCSVLCFAQNNVIEEARVIAAKAFHEYHKEVTGFLQNKKEITYDSTYHHTVFKEEIVTPFDMVKILLFTLDAIDPRITMLVTATKKHYDIVIVDSVHSVIELFNQMSFYKSKHFTNDELMCLPRLWAKVESPYYELNKVVLKWQDIDWEKDEIVDDGLKNIILPPKILEKSNRRIIEFYYWQSGSAELYKIRIEYDGKIFSSDKVFIGKYGQPHLII